MKKITLTFLMIIIYFSLIYSADSKVGTTAAQFLKIEIGARGLAMGGAFVATADDATATFWNPAGLAKLQSKEVTVQHVDWLANMDLKHGGIVVPVGDQAFGFYLTFMDYGEWDVTTIDAPDGTGERFGAQDLAIGMSYSRNITNRFSFGANVKYISQKIWHMNASAVAFDIGTIFETQFKGLRIGMSFTNFGSKMSMTGKDAKVFQDVGPEIEGNNERINAYLETEEWDLPLAFRVGAAMDVINNNYSKLTVALDTVAPNDNLEYINAGCEYGWKRFLFLRAGYKSLFIKESETGLTLGTGIRYGINNQVKIKFDYAYADFGRLGDVQFLSLGFEF